MTEVQQKWIKDKQNELDTYIQQHFPMDDSECEYVVDYVSSIVAKVRAKDENSGNEVRRALFDVLEKWERKLHEST